MHAVIRQPRTLVVFFSIEQSRRAGNDRATDRLTALEFEMIAVWA
jgi:hypothetical protein